MSQGRIEWEDQFYMYQDWLVTYLYWVLTLLAWACVAGFLAQKVVQKCNLHEWITAILIVVPVSVIFALSLTSLVFISLVIDLRSAFGVVHWSSTASSTSLLGIFFYVTGFVAKSRCKASIMELLLAGLLRCYYMTMVSGLRGRNNASACRIFFFVWILYCFAFPYLSRHICIAYNPYELSTAFTRALVHESSCGNGKICHLYLTTPEVITTFSLSELWISTQDQSHMIEAVVKKLDVETDRYVLYFFLSQLKPDSTYYMKTRIRLRPSSRLFTWPAFISSFFASPLARPVVETLTLGPDMVGSPTIKFRTFPAHSVDPYTFVVGGDWARNSDMEQITRRAVATEPLMVAVGGDISYDNSFSGCYHIWDDVLWAWERNSVTPLGFTVPLLVAIGNHEAGGIYRPYETMAPYFEAYFPHRDSVVLGEMNRYGRKVVDEGPHALYHSHRLSGDTLLVVLDSVMNDIADTRFYERSAQYKWLNTTVMGRLRCNKSQNVFVSYPHISKPRWISKRAAKDVPISKTTHRENRCGASVAFENHMHAYKRTFEMHSKSDRETGSPGVVYIGDGGWGVKVKAKTRGMKTPYVDAFRSTMHFLVVTVSNGTVSVEARDIEGRPFDYWHSHRGDPQS